MKTSRNGIEQIKRLEGVRAKVYRDSAGLLTVGVGHLLTPAERESGNVLVEVPYESGLSDEVIDLLLRQDLQSVEAAVQAAVKVSLSQSQYDALVSFVFNIGTGAFRGSTLLRELNKGRYDEVPRQLARWVYAGGKRVRGLENRRKAEIALWETSDNR